MINVGTVSMIRLAIIHTRNWVIHSFLTTIHSSFTGLHVVLGLHSAKLATSKGFRLINVCGKNKNRNIWQVSRKKCYFVGISTNLTQTLDIDRLSGRIRGHIRCKGPLSSTGRLQKAATGRRRFPLCYQQGIREMLVSVPREKLGAPVRQNQGFE